MTNEAQGDAGKKKPPSFAAMAFEFAVVFVPISLGVNWAWNAAAHEPFDFAKSARDSAITGVLAGIFFAWWFRRRAHLR